MGAVRLAFSKNLLYHRERLGLTQATLAEKIDSSPSYVGHLERGEREPSLLTIEELCKALSIEAGELFVRRGARDAATQSHHELQELVRGRDQEDLRLVLRLARAAFEDPRLVAAGSDNVGSPGRQHHRGAGRSRRAKKTAKG